MESVILAPPPVASFPNIDLNPDLPHDCHEQIIRQPNNDTTHNLDMKAEIDGPTAVAEKDTTMQPPSSYRQPLSHTNHDENKTNTKRRQSRFDPMGNETEDDEGYGDVSHRHHSFRKLNEDEPRASFTLPGIHSLLNAPSGGESTYKGWSCRADAVCRLTWPGHARESGSSSSTPYHQSPSLPSLVSNSPSASPSTLRTSRYSSMTSASSISADSHNGGWWAPEFERTHSSASGHRVPLPPATLGMDDNEAKRRRSDQPLSAHDQDEQARLRYMAQSRNASYPTNGLIPPGPHGNRSSFSSPIMRSMQPPAPPVAGVSAGMSRNAHSHQDHLPHDRRPSAVPRSMSLVSGPLATSFADLTANERERERQGSGTTHDMPPPFPSPMGTDRDRRLSSLMSDNSQIEIQRMRTHTSTPPERFRAFSHPPEHETPRPGAPRTARSSLSEQIMAQSGDAQGMSGERARYPSDGSLGAEKPPHHPGATAWPATRRSSNSSSHSNSTPGVTVNLNSDDGHTPTMRYRREIPDDSNNPMGGMDVLAESARRVSEQEEHRRSVSYGTEDREDSPKAGPGGPKYQCAYCTKTFSRPSSLRIHTYSRKSIPSLPSTHIS